MYPVDERDKVIELQGVPRPSVGAPLPVVLSDEHKTLLGYIIQDAPDTLELTPDETFALIEFQRCRSYTFGSPNDEAFAGHPLANRGLQSYACFQIEDSSWIRQLERMNSVHPFHDPEVFSRYRHFVFAFHDSTFECVAENFTVSEHYGTVESLVSVMQRCLVGDSI
jgi:hypothetical protein